MGKFIKVSILLLAAVFLFSPLSGAEAYVKVKGYYRKDGTYVRPHVRSNPNGLKFDNYSYTPGQGLYNKTYGTRGKEWDTPTTITDPDYYLGKSLYESGSSGTGSTSYKKAPPNCYSWQQHFNGKCYNIPTNAHAVVSSNDAWLCDYGYEEANNRCIKKGSRSYFKGRWYTIPANAHAVVSSTDAWLCDDGYREWYNMCVKR